MPLARDESTAYFQMVHRLLEAQEDADKDAEGRAHKRSPYPRLQLVAPWTGGRMPEVAAFRPVRCFDLSASGFSFLSPEQPEGPRLVVALGSDPKLTYLTAEVVHETAVRLVGCRFTGRIQG